MSITGEHTAGKKDVVAQGVRGGRIKSDIERVYDWFGQVQAREGTKQLVEYLTVATVESRDRKRKAIGWPSALA